MVELSVKRKHNGMPIISNFQIEDWAVALLGDYDSSVLTTPKPIDIEAFVEFYLGISVQYADLTHNQSILGTIALSDGKHIVYDREHNNILTRELKAGNVLIDNSLLECESEGRRNFTLAHEAGHYITLKPIIRSRDTNQLCMFDSFSSSSVIQCRANHIISEGAKVVNSKSTDEEWMEWHADSLGAALLMPKPAMAILTKQLWNDYGIKDRIVLGTCNYMDALAKDIFPATIAQIFKVSKQAASIRLKRLNYVTQNIAQQQLVI